MCREPRGGVARVAPASGQAASDATVRTLRHARGSARGCGGSGTLALTCSCPQLTLSCPQQQAHSAAAAAAPADTRLECAMPERRWGVARRSGRQRERAPKARTQRWHGCSARRRWAPEVRTSGRVPTGAHRQRGAISDCSPLIFDEIDGHGPLPQAFPVPPLPTVRVLLANGLPGGACRCPLR